MIKCEICDKEFSVYGIKSHIWRSHGEGKSHDPNKGLKNGSRTIWNKGLNSENDVRVLKSKLTLVNRFELGELIPSFKGKYHSEQTKENIRKTVSENIKNGKQNGWRKKVKSYPELFFEEVLKNNNLFDKCIPQQHINNGKKNYFLDFFFPQKNIDLEIDGSQHSQRKESDNERDLFLKSLNIKVYRISWFNVNSIKGMDMMKNEVDKFLLFYQNNWV